MASLFGEALAKPLSFSVAYFRTVLAVALHPLLLARGLGREDDASNPPEISGRKCIAPGAFMASSLSLFAVCRSMTAPITGEANPDLLGKALVGLYVIAIGLTFAVLARAKPMTFSAALFSYVVGGSLCVMAMVDLSGLLAAKLEGVSRLDLACSSREPGFVLHHLRDFSACNYIDFTFGIVVLLTFLYIGVLMKVVQGLGIWRTTAAFFLTSLLQYPLAIVLALFARGIRALLA